MTTFRMFLFGLMMTRFAVDLSSSTPIENDSQLLLLAARFDGLQAKMDQLLDQLEDEKIHRTNLQTLNDKLETKIDFLMSQSTKQEEEIRGLKNRNCADNIIQSKPQENVISNIDDVSEDSPSSLPKLPPSSCRQLSTIGHYLDGIYLVGNQDTNKIETVYCDFGTTISETLYGNVDVKIQSVHFFVQRSTTNFELTNVVIPFDIERLNVGGAMNLATGVFTVPVDGIYHFEFSALKYSDTNSVYVYLQLNGVNIGISYATNLQDFLSLNGISASLRLKIGDQVRLYKTTGTLDDIVPFTHFTGWLVEEDLVLAVQKTA